MTPPRLEVVSCAAPTMALAHVHTARRLHFAKSSDGLLLSLSEECWGRGRAPEREAGRSAPRRSSSPLLTMRRFLTGLLLASPLALMAPAQGQPTSDSGLRQRSGHVAHRVCADIRF